jgi:hypothetical protein
VTNIAIIEKQLARCTDRLDRATERIEAIAQERQALGFDLHVNESKEAELRLKGTRVELSSLAEEKETLTGAIVELKKRLAAEQQATNREIARGHTKRLHEQLRALQELAGPLDMCLGSMGPGQMGGSRYVPGLANPPLLDRAGTLVAEIIGELEALGRGRGVKWPPRRWSLGHAEDLRRDVQAFVEHFGHLPAPSGRNFAGLIGVLMASVKAQHDEQTNKAEEIAA